LATRAERLRDKARADTNRETQASIAFQAFFAPQAA